jgi:aspartyl protease family protein
MQWPIQAWQIYAFYPLGIDFKNNSRVAESETANGLVTIYIVKLASVEIGGIKINNVEVAIHEGEFPSQVLLGMSFLKTN